jgi:hypothetical protein
VPTWYQTEAGQVRLARDRAVVTELQPGLRYEERDGALGLVGDVVIRTTSGIPLRTPLQIDFPDDYPQTEPSARDVAQRFLPHDADHHFIGDKLCLWVGIESRFRSDDPDGLRKFLTEVSVQLMRNFVWEDDPAGGYPGAARPHGPTAAYVEIVSEALRLPKSVVPRMWSALGGQVGRNTRCPCGSGVRYRNCCRRLVDRFRRAHTADDVALAAAVLRRSMRRADLMQEKGASA